MVREEMNRILRSSFNDILNHKPTGKELIRQKEIDKIVRKEKEDYEKKRLISIIILYIGIITNEEDMVYMY